MATPKKQRASLRAVSTKNYEKRILSMDVNVKCRKCGVVGKTIEHIISGCSALADSAYLNRHNKLGKVVH